jgi:hypothetical protein
MTDSGPNLPATTEPAAAVPALPPPPAEAQPPSRPRQNVTTGLFPIALGLLVIVFIALALWTLMATTGGGGL